MPALRRCTITDDTRLTIKLSRRDVDKVIQVLQDLGDDYIDNAFDDVDEAEGNRLIRIAARIEWQVK